MRGLGLLLLCFLQASCIAQRFEKINGVSFVASPDRVNQQHVDPVVKVNANYAAIMPFGFIRSLKSPNVVFNTQRQWFGETRAGAKQYIELLKQNGIKIMLKPQLWVWHGEFTGHVAMDNEKDWNTLEESYADFVMTYAKLAAETGAEVYCIGTELEGFVKNRPQFWKSLIAQVRKVYKGKLTYAANWDEYPRVPFWKELDYIGVDAYFPLSEERFPTIEELQSGWQPWKAKLAEITTKNERPMIFTEFGYRSMDFTAKKPWLVDRNEMEVNLDAQSAATKALFEEFWNEDWFAGGFVWKWFIHHDRVGGEADNRFTPQNKPVEKVIEQHYGSYQ